MELLFLLAIAAAVMAVGIRKLRTGPVFAEERAPRVVSSHREIDDALPNRCPCGGRFQRRGEGPKRVDGAECVRVLVSCEKCERRRALLFTLAS